MRIAHIIPCRNKAAVVAATVAAALDQTYPSHIILSDQGSTDGSLEILRSMAMRYRGPHKVTVFSCPETEPVGMRGMNAHLDWLMANTDEPYVMITSADDIPYPERTAKVAEAFEAHKPDMVLTKIHFVYPDGLIYGHTANPEVEGFVDPTLCINGLVGGSTSHAMTREFYEAVGGFEGICGFDAYWPFLATVRNGAWFINEPLHAYVSYADVQNTGLEGISRAADEDGKLAVEELMHFQVQTSYIKAALTMQAWGIENQKATDTLLQAILDRATGWTAAREKMTLKRIAPLSLKA